MESTEVGYKPSRQQFYETQEKLNALLNDGSPESNLVNAVSDAVKQIGHVGDFTGKIDGAGVKAVMVAPKTPIELIPPQFVEGIAGVLLHGKKKYAANNWMRGMEWATVFGGILRHLWAWFRGEEMDPESGLPHLYHAACGIMFLSWFAYGPDHEQHKQFDNRVFRGVSHAG